MKIAEKKGISRNTLSAHPNWKGGLRKRGKYTYVRVFNHPNSDVMGYVAEHRLKMEKKLGRYLTENEIVHHKNEDTRDNRLSNLEVMTKSAHCILHNREQRKAEKLHEGWKRSAALFGTNTYLWKA